jgi:abortive infection bacteriophage resistance protein
MLTIKEQIAHLEDKGVTFKQMSKEDAAEYLKTKNNFLRVASSRVVFFKQLQGNDVGKYLNLDFAYLVELASIDRMLREIMIGITLDIEHFAKVKVISRITDDPAEDGYRIVEDFIVSLPERFRINMNSELRSRGSARGGDPYCGELIARYRSDMPVWVLLEVIPFGTFLTFYRFCSERWDDRHMLDEYYMMKKVKSVRNASCHGSCIINGFRPSAHSQFRTAEPVTSALSKGGIRKSRNRSAKLGNVAMQQIVTTLYMYSALVDSEDAKERTTRALQALKTRFMEHRRWFAKSNNLLSFLEFASSVIDIWFPLVQDNRTRKKP